MERAFVHALVHHLGLDRRTGVDQAYVVSPVVFHQREVAQSTVDVRERRPQERYVGVDEEHRVVRQQKLEHDRRV